MLRLLLALIDHILPRRSLSKSLIMSMGSGHIQYDNNVSDFGAKSIKREDSARRQFALTKYEFQRSTNPITGVTDTSMFVYPPTLRDPSGEEARLSSQKLAEFERIQRQKKGSLLL